MRTEQEREDLIEGSPIELYNLLEQAEAQLAVKTKLINNIKTCCSIRSVTAFLDRYEQALGNDDG